jgi:diaminopropionate ammonia-lyase
MIDIASPSWLAHQRSLDWRCEPASTAARAFHRSLTGYAPTPLVDLPSLADELGVGRVLAKDESKRLGLSAFKALGASWAIHRVLQDQAATRDVTVVAATDGNHGRAVARFARQLGHRAAIFVTAKVHPRAVQAIVDEGAAVTVVEGSYDEAVVAAAAAAEAADTVLIQDTAWEGYERIPGWIVEGYATLFAEIDEYLRVAAPDRPDLVVVPTGVGSLLQAALTHYRSRSTEPGTALVSVEPEAAAWVAASLAAGHPVTVRTHATAMAGLNCGTASTLAWPMISNGLDAAVTVGEADATQAAYDLAALGVPAGPCGAAPLAALRVALTGTGHRERRQHLQITAESTVILLVTEGSEANPVPDLAKTRLSDPELSATELSGTRLSATELSDSELGLLRRALQLAVDAKSRGRHPFGALVADADGRVIAERGNNAMPPEGDPTQHAELSAAAAAARRATPQRLAEATLYSSAEPCAMCAGAIYWTGVGRVVYALSEERLLELTGDNAENPTLALPCREVFARGQRPVDVVGPMLEDLAAEPHVGFWR